MNTHETFEIIDHERTKAILQRAGFTFHGYRKVDDPTYHDTTRGHFDAPGESYPAAHLEGNTLTLVNKGEPGFLEYHDKIIRRALIKAGTEPKPDVQPRFL